MAARKRWRKILYENQGYPDNYVEPTEFLKGLRTNVSVVRYTVGEAFTGAAILSSQIAITVLYLATFQFIRLDVLSLERLLSLTVALLVFCLGLYLGLHWREVKRRDVFLDNAQSIITASCIGYGFTPVIRTLTVTISTDSIYTMAFCLLLLALVFHDYGMDGPIVSSAFSLNLALAAGICLVSRVDSDAIAFCLLAKALCAFSFWPSLRNEIAAFAPTRLVVVMTPVLLCSSTATVAAISVPTAVLYAVVQFFVVCFCPLLLVYLQRFKSTIHGPWDEAVLGGK